LLEEEGGKKGRRTERCRSRKVYVVGRVDYSNKTYDETITKLMIMKTRKRGSRISRQQ
jgi:hypothetical protein